MAIKINNGPMTDAVYKDLVLIAKNEQGYFNLSELMSRSYTVYGKESEPHIDFADLQELNEGIICLTGGYNGPLGYFLIGKQEEKAKELLENLHDTFRDRLYIELSRHGLSEEDFCEKYFIDWAYEKKIPLVATNNVFFKDTSMHEAHDALLCISGGNYVVEDNRRKETPEHYFKTAEEMTELFSDIPEAIANTIQISKRCSFFLDEKAPLLPHFDCEEGRTEEEELKFQAEQGLLEKLDKFVYTDSMTPEEKDVKKKEYFERLEYEISIINRMGFPGYFLICMDFIKWAKNNDIPLEKIENLVGEYLYTQKLPRGQEIADILSKQPRILERKGIISRIKSAIENIIDVFEW
jgi:DNA polymerase-3 subunit alpha